MGWAAYRQMVLQLGRQYLQRSGAGTGKVLEGLQGSPENARQLTAMLLGGIQTGQASQGQQGEMQRLLLQLMRRQLAQLQAPESRRRESQAGQAVQEEARKAEADREETRKRTAQAKQLDRQVEELVKKSAKLALVFGGIPLALMGFTAAVIKAARAAREHARALAKVSPEMAAVDAANMIREIRRMQQSGRATAASTAYASSAWQDLQDTLRPIRDFFLNLKNLMIGTLLRILVGTLRTLFAAISVLSPGLATMIRLLSQMNENLEQVARRNAAPGREVLAEILQGNFGGQIVQHPII